MGRRSINAVFLVLMAVLCLAPLLQMSTGIFHFPSLDERRQPTTVDGLAQRLLWLDPSLAADVNSWFNDHYGFREVFVRADHELAYQVFRDADRVYVGPDGWLNDKTIVSIVVSKATKPEQDGPIIAGIVNLNQCLASRGIKMLVRLDPSKPSIYPGSLPWYAPAMPQVSQYDRLIVALKSRQVAIMDSKALLLAHRDDHRLFAMTDPHLNHRGTDVLDGAMIETIANMLGREVKRSELPAWKSNRVSGSESRFLSKFIKVDEPSEYRPAPPLFVDNAVNKWTKNVGEGGVPGHEDLPTFDWIYRNVSGDPNLLPPIAIFGTSFTDGLFGIGDNRLFKAIYRAKSSIPTRIHAFLRDLPPEVKLVLLEYPEFEFVYAAQMPIALDCSDSNALRPPETSPDVLPDDPIR